MINMNWLELDDNRVPSVAPLAGMTALEKLYLENNRVTVLAPLVELKVLRELQARGNDISNEQSSLLIKALPDCRIHAGVFSTNPTRKPRNP